MSTPTQQARHLTKLIRRLRAARGLKQFEFAQVWGVDPGTVSRIEAGEPGNMGYFLLCSLVERFNLNPSEVFPTS